VDKDAAGFHLWDTPHGRFWIPKGSDYMLPWDLAEQERHIYGTGERAVRAGDVVLDCGANVGVYTREALKNGAKLVVAIELAPENIECLRRNFSQEIAAGRVIVYPKGVWDKDDFLTLNVDPENSAADSVVMKPEKSRQGPRVPLTTIDKLVADLKLDRVDYIKMDIEGAEQKALAGARETLRKFHPRMALSAYHVADDPRRIPELARAAWPGYRTECGPCADGTTFVRPDVIYFF
jgi:FkbM family methyltransferase